MSTTFITAYYTSDHINGFKKDDMYWNQFQRLLATHVPIIAYLDPGAYETYLSLHLQNDMLEVIPVPPLDKTWLPEAVKLPAHRNKAKDTLDFFLMMLHKFYFLEQAHDRVNTEYIAWIDFGIFHIVKDEIATRGMLQKLTQISTFRTDRILIPGCVDYQASHWQEQLLDIISWKFCGGFMLGHKDLFVGLFDRQMKMVHDHLPHLTWEVNYWVKLQDMSDSNLFLLYEADHNDSMFRIPLVYPYILNDA